MKTEEKSLQELLKENEKLRIKLAEAEETLKAIQNGEVDAVVVSGPRGKQVFTFEGADHAYRLLVDTMSEGAATLAFDGTVMYCNKRLSEMLKVPVGKITGGSLEKYILPQDLSGYSSIITRGLIRPVRGEISFWRSDGAVISAQISCNSLKTENKGVCLIVTDLTLGRSVEAEMKLQARAMEAADDGIFIIDARKPDFQIIYHNRAFRKMTGYDKKNILGQSYLRLCGTGDKYRSNEDVKKALEQGLDFHGEILTCRKNNKILYILLRLAPVRDKTGGIINFVGVQTDITVKKREELLINTQREELLHVTRVGKLAEFVSSLAHEINQPLTAILAYTQALQRMLTGRPHSEVRKILSYISADDRRAANIIERLRSLLKKERIEMKSFDINTLISRTVALVSTEAIVKNISIKLELGKDLPHIRGDRVQLQQVLLNLISNGFDAIKSGRNLHEISIRTAFEKGGMIMVAVKDSGCGIPEKNLGKIFNHFFTSKPDGLGMGLSISRSIIEAHGGKLQVKNNPACGGAVFYFIIPVYKKEAQ